MDKKHYANLPWMGDWHSWGRMMNCAIYFFSSSISSKYCPHSRKMLDRFLREFELVRPELEQAGVDLALENLPSFDGFPDVAEARELMAQCAGSPLKLWLDTGHALVRETRGWDADAAHAAAELAPWIRGMHLNDAMKPRGSRVDRHQPLGDGLIGEPCFRYVLTQPQFEHIPLILETPDESRWAEEIARLKAFSAKSE